MAQAVSVFPSDDLTVRDGTQLTGRRVNLPLPDCAARPTDCNTVRLLNQLDGFDLDPRLALRFAAPVDPAAIAAATVVEQLGGSRDGARTGVERVVYDAATNTVFAHPAQQLSPGTTYRLRVGNTGGNNTGGNNTGGGGPVPRAQSAFTTLLGTDGLTDMVRQLDNGSAYRAAGIPGGARGLQVDAAFPAAGTTMTYTRDLGSNKKATDPVLNTSGAAAGTYVFGSYLAPSWLTPDGDGFTRTDADLFLAATQNAARGLVTICHRRGGSRLRPAEAR